MLTAYYDDTGKRGDTAVVCLFGFVAELEQWMRFDDDWRFVLNLPQFRLPYFHMREVRQAARAKEQAFHKFQNNDSLRRDLFERLQHVIRARVLQSFSAIVMMADYNRLNADYEVEEQLGSPAAVATGVSIGKFLAWRNDRRPTEPFKVVCDQGMDDFSQLADKVHESWGFRLIPGVVDDTPGLQASDFAAWELQRAMSDVARGAVSYWDELRPPFVKFLKQFILTFEDGNQLPWFLIDEEQLMRLIQKNSVPKRTSAPQEHAGALP